MKAQIVSFHCVLKTKLGKVISSTFNQDVITRDGHQPADLLKGLVLGLQDLKIGERRQISLSAADAYGFYDPAQVLKKSRDEFPPEEPLRLGSRVVLESARTGRKVFRVTEINNEFLVLDANHPLAGEDLVFEIEATAVRDATSDEIQDSLAVVDIENLH